MQPSDSSPTAVSSDEINANLSHTIGNVMNQIIFGMTYAAEDPMWIKLQKLRDEGNSVLNHLN